MADFGSKLISLVIGLAIAFGVLAGAFLPQLSTWALQVSDINNVDYGWVVWLIAMIVIFMLLKYAQSLLKMGKGW